MASSSHLGSKTPAHKYGNIFEYSASQRILMFNGEEKKNEKEKGFFYIGCFIQ